MKKFDVHVIDDALDKDSNVAVCRSAVEHEGKWATPIDDLDIYWFDLQDMLLALYCNHTPIYLLKPF